MVTAYFAKMERKEGSMDWGRVIREYTHSQDVIKVVEENNHKEGGTMNMCRASREMIEDGKKQGRQEAEEQFGNLILRLLGDNKTNDLERAGRDAKYRQKQLREYKIGV